MSGHVFIDETKQRGYLMVAGVVVADDLDVLRKTIRSLILPGQRRLHMKNENDRRKHAIASAIVATDIQVTVYDAARRYRNERERRAACLRAVVNDAAARAHPVLVLEQDDSLLSWDNQHLIEFTRAAGCRDTLRISAPQNHRRAPARNTRRDRMVLGQGRRLAPPHPTSRHRRTRGLKASPTSAKPERRSRPAGSRAHFLKLTATGTLHCRL